MRHDSRTPVAVADDGGGVLPVAEGVERDDVIDVELLQDRLPGSGLRDRLPPVTASVPGMRSYCQDLWIKNI